MKFRKSVFIVIYSKKKKLKYLIFRRKLHWKGWEFAKGGLEKGEKEIDAVRREVFEESGLRAVKIKKLDVSGKYEYGREFKDREGITGQTYSLYSAEIEKGKIQIDKKEHSGYKWVGFEKAMKKLTWPNQKECLGVVNEWLVTLK